MLDVLATLAGAVLLFAFGVLVPVALRVRGGLALTVAALVMAAADVVLLTICLSLLDALTAGWMLLGQALSVAIAAVAGALAARREPAPPSPALPGRARAMAAAREHPAVTVAVAMAALVLLVTAFLAVAVAPNNWDSMTYHLARIGYWLQFDSALHFDNGTSRQLAQPPNGEFLQAWTILMSGTDRLAALVQWSALVGLAAATCLGARFLGFGRPAALFAGALFVLLPQPTLQASTTQNDLIVCFFLVAALVFAVRGLRDRHTGELAVGAVALGVAVGAKGTALLVLPSVAIVLVAAVVAYRPPPRILARAAALGVSAVAALGAFNYVLNQDTFGTPFGPIRDTVERTSAVPANSLRVAWTFVDSPGVIAPWLNNALARPAHGIFGDQSTRDFRGFSLDSTVNEDVSAYGLVGLFIVLPLFLIVLLAPRSPPARRVLAGAALAFLVVFALTSEYNPWVGRVMMPAVAIGAPLLAALCSRPVLGAAAVALALAGAMPSLFANDLKPLLVPIGQETILERDRNEQQALARPEMVSVVRGLRAASEPDAPIGLVRGYDTWDYVFFGRQLRRRVVPLRHAQATHATMRRLGLRGIAFANVPRPPRRLRARPLSRGYWFALAPPR